MNERTPHISIPLPRNAVLRAVSIYSAIALLVLLSIPTALRAFYLPGWITTALVLAAFVGLIITALGAWVVHRRGRAV